METTVTCPEGGHVVLQRYCPVCVFFQLGRKEGNSQTVSEAYSTVCDFYAQVVICMLVGALDIAVKKVARGRFSTQAALTIAHCSEEHGTAAVLGLVCTS